MAEKDLRDTIASAQSRVDELLETTKGGGEGLGAALPESVERLEQTLRDLTDTLAEMCGGTDGGEEEPRRREAGSRHYWELFNFSPDGYLVTDSSGTIAEGNVAAAALLGLPQERLAGVAMSTFLSEPDREKFRDRLCRIPELRELEDWEVQIQPCAGSSFPAMLAVRAAGCDGDQPAVLTWMIRDITEQKRAERQMRDAMSFLQQVLDSSPNLIFIRNEQGQTVFVNKAVTDHYGTASEELEESNIAQVHPDEQDRSEFARFDREVIESRQATVVDERHVTRDGRELWFHTVRVPMIRADGTVQVLGIATDITLRRRTEEALRQSEARLDLAVKGSTDGLWDWPDLGRDDEWWSPRFYELLGYENGEFRLNASKFQELLHPKDRERTAAALRAHLEERAPYDVEYRLKTKSGEYRWFRARGQALWDPEGNPVRMAGSIQDIHDWKEAEKALSTTTNTLNNILGSATEYGIAATDRDLRVIHYNAAAARIFGCAADEVLGCKVPEILAERGIAGRRIESAARVAVSEGKWETRLTLPGPSGEQRLVRPVVMPMRDETGSCTGYVLFVRDVTEEKRYERALQKERDFVAAILDTVGALVTVLDREGRIVWFNRTCQEVTGHTFEEVQGRPIGEVFPLPNEEDQVKDGFKNPLASRFQNQFGNYWLTKDGRRRLISWSNTCLPGSDGEVEYVIATGIDITERQCAEELARRRQAELAHVSRLSTMGEMASGIAHELNQPLTAISNYTNGCVRRLQMDPHRPDELLGVMEEVATQAQRAGEIIRRLKAFVSKGGGRRSTGDINRIVGDVIHFVELDARQQGVKIRLELGDDLGPTLVDGVQIQQVVLNLLRNALEAMREVDSERHTMLVRTSVVGPERIEVTVCDTGSGFSTEDADKLFHPFFTTKPRGMGMGLSISRTIIEAHGGRLWAESNPGGGATFRFTLPITEGGNRHE